MKNALIAEFIGTFFLYLMIGMCVTPPSAAGVAVPLAIGVGLAALVYSCGHLSKAHFNPATTIAYATAGTHTLKKSVPYILVIFAGALSSAVLCFFCGIFTSIALLICWPRRPGFGDDNVGRVPLSAACPFQ